MKAMLLAAGRGKRMRPLTDKTPKALIPVGPHRLIEYNLFKLKAAGVKEVVINVSYLANQITRFIGDGSRYGLNVVYSYEPGECLGTGGGVFQALPLLGDEPFLLLSADIWSDCAFDKIHFAQGKEAHLIMVHNPSYHSGGDYGLDEMGLLSLHTPKFTYSGMSVVHPKLFKHCKAGIFSLSPLINDAIKRGCVSGELYSGRWFNVGTPEQLKLLGETFVQ